uniref:C2H2-type domain-containing protein n=1 Tax=Panagrolaimus sp. PS1159 TaxID=55785 RepID=A0AC35GXL3_9BILA
MQNPNSAFPHLGFSQNQSEKANDFQLPPELQLLLSASLDQGLYANQLAALKNATVSANPTTSTAVNGIPSDFASLLLSSLTQQQPQQQQQLQQQQQNTPSTEIQQQQQQIPTPASTTATSSAATQQQQQDDFAQLMALIAGPQAQAQQAAAAAATNNLLEQMNFFASPNFNNNISTSQHQNSSAIVPTTPTSSGSGSHFFGGGINASMNSPTKDSYCEFCDKNFCNRYFLRIHKQKKHGIRMETTNGENDTPPAKQPKLEQSVSPIKLQQQQSSSSSSVPAAPVSNEHEEPPKQKESMDGIPNNIEAMLAAFQEAQNSKASSQPDLLSLIQQFAKVKSPEPQTEKFNCDKCSQDFTSQTLLFQHQLTQHTVIPSSSPPTSTSSSQQQQQQQNLLNSMNLAGFSSLPFMMPQLSSNFPTLEMENAFGSHPALSQSLSSKPAAPKRQYSSTTKNYCDLCNKEVCNKYFLRTHMLKMHNIVIDENKTVIANIDTQEKEKEGSVSFRCDVCHTDMKTRTQLKDHKKSVHGIQPVVAPSSASLSRASSSKPQSAIGSGSSQGGETTAFEFPPTSTSPQQIELKCDRCEIDFDTFHGLVAHIRDEHSNEISEQEIVELLAKCSSTVPAPFQQHPQEVGTVTAEEKQVSGTEDENDEAMEITREVAMKMAVENQMKHNDDEMETDAVTFLCNTCGRNYSTQQNLDDHVSTVHQYKVRLSPKKEAKTILSPSKVNKMIKCFTCAKCNQRFATSHLCKLHIIQHLRREQKPAETNETINGESSSSSGGVEAAADEHKENKETTEDFEDELISSFMREESSTRDKSGSIIEHVVSELSRRGSHGGLAKLPEEKHSHTSGSASPMSVHTMPEGYAQPLPVASSSPKPFVLQSFVMREVSDSNAFPTELHAYLPVRNLIDGPIRVTFELQAAPQIDAQIKNL